MFISALLASVKVAQLEEAWTVNHAVGRLSVSDIKLTKNLQQAFNPFNPKIAESFGLIPKFDTTIISWAL